MRSHCVSSDCVHSEIVRSSVALCKMAPCSLNAGCKTQIPPKNSRNPPLMRDFPPASLGHDCPIRSRLAESLAAVTPETVTHGVAVHDPDIPAHNGVPVPFWPEHGVAAPAVPPELLLESQRRQIDALHQVSSFSRADFDAYIRPVIERYAAFVHLLPASESQHHCGQGGLFRHGLEVAFHAALACEGKVFAFEHWASERERLVPRWRMCALIGGMMHDIGKPVMDVGAVDVTGNLTWNPHVGSLWDWLREHGLNEYYIRWRPGARHKRHEAFSTLALYRLIPDATLRWLAAFGGQEPMDQMILALMGTSDPNNPLANIIRDADSRSVGADVKASRERMAGSGKGGANSLALRLIRAMHDLIQDGTWTINEVGTSPIWMTTQGVFGMTEIVIKGAVAALREQGETSIPTDYRQTLNLLDDWGFLHPNQQADGSAFLTWQVRIFAENKGKPATFDAHAIRFSRDDVLPRALIPPQPLRAVLLDADGQPLAGQVQVEEMPLDDQASDAEDPAGNASMLSVPGMEAVLADVEAPLQEADSDDDALYLYGGSHGEMDGDGLLLHAGLAVDDDDTPAPPPSPIRDRSQEQDPRDEQMQAARQQTGQRENASPDAAREWFTRQGTEGAVLLSLADRVQQGTLAMGTDLVIVNDKVHIRFPEALAGLGMEAATIRTGLEEKGWTERDLNTPSRATVMLPLPGGKRAVALRFNAAISRGLLRLLPESAGTMTTAPPPARTAPSEPVRKPTRRARPTPPIKPNLPELSPEPATEPTPGTPAVPLALGPFLPAAVVARLADPIAAHPQDSPLVRPCFHRFVLKKLDESGRGLDTLTDTDIRRAVTLFSRQHQTITTPWLMFHLTRGRNPWSIRAQTAKNQQLAFNPKYSVEQDEAVSRETST